MNYRPEQGEGVLSIHRRTSDEEILFKEMDSAVFSKNNGDFEKDFKIVAKIGKKYGLNRSKSISFWVRSAFCLYAPDE